MKNPILATESFYNNRKRYFLDFKLAANNSPYIKITRSDEQQDHTYKRSEVVVFEEDFEFLIEAFSSLFRTVAYQGGQGDPIKPDKRDRTRGIKSWEAPERPREKLMEQGKPALSDAELLAIVIGSGSPNETAVGLAARILDSVGGDLKRLTELRLNELCRFRGMGHAKSLSIIAAMELAARLTAGQHKAAWLRKAE